MDCTPRGSVAAAAPPAASPVASSTTTVAPVAAPPAPQIQLQRPAAEPAAPPSPAMLDKLALGDKLHPAGDARGALFAYQDAVYLEPRNATARVKLGRAYWALRYVGQAEEQWQQATQLAPNDPSITYQIDEAKKAPRPAIAEPSHGFAVSVAEFLGVGSCPPVPTGRQSAAAAS